MSSGTSGNGGNGAGGDPILAELRLIRAEAQRTNTRLESLEQATVAGFGIVGDRLRSMDERLGSMDERLGSLEVTTHSMDLRLSSLEEHLSSIRHVAVAGHLEHDQRLIKIETRLDTIEADLPKKPRS